MRDHRYLLLWLLCAGLAGVQAIEPGLPPVKAPSTTGAAKEPGDTAKAADQDKDQNKDQNDDAAAAEKPGGPPAPGGPVVDGAVRIVGVEVEKDTDNSLVRLTVQLDGLKRSIDSKQLGPASFQVTIPRAAPAKKMPRRVVVATDAVADLVLRPDGPDTQVTVRLNTPVRWRAYVVPSKKAVIIECETVPPPDEGTDDKGDKKDAKKTGAFGDQIITAEFVDTDIRVIIEALVAQSGANIMLQPGVSGNYSLSLKDVTLTQALDALWEAWGLVWMELPGNIYLVGTEANLGDRRADVSFALPTGWKLGEFWQVLAEQYPELKLQRELKTLAAVGPLPLYGPLKVVGRARRWLAALPPVGEGDRAVLPVPPKTESRAVKTVNLTASEAEEMLKTKFPQLSVSLDADGEKLTLVGPPEEVLRAKRYLADQDTRAAKEVKEAAWLASVTPEKVAELARITGVTITIISTDADGVTVMLVGKEDDVKALRSLVQQLQERARANRDRDEKDHASERGTVTRSYALGALSADQAMKVVAATGAPVSTKVEAGNLSISGRADRVAEVMVALSRADQSRVTKVYAVRYAHTQDLLRAVREAVPELRVIEFMSHRATGEPDPVDLRRVGPPVPAAAPEADVKTAPSRPAPETLELLGPHPRLLLSGSEESVTRAVTFLEQVDQAPPEVELAAVIAELSPACATALGIDWASHPAAGPLVVGSLVKGPMDLAEAAETIGRDKLSTVLARPRLRAVDGGLTRLLIGQRIRLKSWPPAAGAAPAPTETDRVGVILEVVPRVPGDGTILLRVHPEVSQPGADGAVKTRETDLTLRLNDGGTMVMGGLLSPEPRPDGSRGEVVVLLSARLVTPPKP